MERSRSPPTPASQRPTSPPQPASNNSPSVSPSSASTAYNIHHSDLESSPNSTTSWRRGAHHQRDSSQDTIMNDNDFDDGNDKGYYKENNNSASSSLLPTSVSKEGRFSPSFNSRKNNNNNSTPTKTVVSIRILVILILISLFSWFYLEALAGGDIEWVKDHLSMLGVNLVLSVLCLTFAMTLIALTPMSSVFAGCLYTGMSITLLALKKWDDGESFETHGAYNMLVFLVIAVPLNGLIQSILLCQRKMTTAKFHRLMTFSVIGTALLTTMMLMYYHSIWGQGANGAHLVHGSQAGKELCEWQGANVPVVDLLPNYVQNFWTGQLSCPAVTGIEAEWTYDGILTIRCLNRAFKDSDQQPTYDILPDTRSWSAADKIMHTYNKKINERIIRRTYTEPVHVDVEGVESIVANCEQDVSKILIRVTRHDEALDRVRAVAKARQEQEETTTKATEEEQKLVDILHGDSPTTDYNDNGTTNIDSTKPAGKKPRKPNVMVLFMDAVARRQFYRKLAKTAAVVASLDKSAQGGPQLHEFFRYHAVGFNTDANSRVVYTNTPDRQDPAAPPIWKDFHEAGYITSRVEDNCEDWSTQYTGRESSQYFDHELQAPFCLPPYYALEGNPFSNFAGPYSIVARCMHGSNVHTYAFDYMNQFRKAYPDQPWFQMGSFIEGHEGTGEVLLTVDNDLAKFLKGMEEDGSLENTIVFMMADHGLHMGINFMFTPSGRIEHMNPYLSVILPPLITKNYPSLARGLAHNQQSLITGYEIHATLKMLASGRMPEYGDDDGEEVDGGAWRKGTLFDEELDPARTCEQAKVPEEYCHCK
ncbi:hypothetical protein F5H01DRAFT_320674 [Linnemannia elongata]|nr:hypothetical protein F5H01DRAFT_320674 [Linnemannia elongata]